MNESKHAKSSTSEADVARVSNLPPFFEEAVLRPSHNMPEGVNLEVRGYDFNQGVDYEALLNSYACTGFQATHFARAVNVLNAVVI